MKTVRICLWSGPRNISTALMYSFAQREDTLVLDEPLYAHYLASSEKELVERHPVAQVVLDGVRAENFLILSHPIAREYMDRKHNDIDRWLRGMGRLRKKLMDE